jgi:hypothetical protein
MHAVSTTQIDKWATNGKTGAATSGSIGSLNFFFIRPGTLARAVSTVPLQPSSVLCVPQLGAMASGLSLLLCLSQSPHNRACVHFDPTFVTPTPRTLAAACVFGHESAVLNILNRLPYLPSSASQREQRARHQLVQCLFSDSFAPLHHAAHLGHVDMVDTLVRRLMLGLESRRVEDLYTPLLAAVAGLDLPRWHTVCRAATLPFVTDRARRGSRQVSESGGESHRFLDRLTVSGSSWVYGFRMGVSLPDVSLALHHGARWQLDGKRVGGGINGMHTGVACSQDVSFDPNVTAGFANDWSVPYAAWARILSHLDFAAQLHAWNRQRRTVILWLVDIPEPVLVSTDSRATVHTSLMDLVRYLQRTMGDNKGNTASPDDAAVGDDLVRSAGQVALEQTTFVDAYFAIKAAIMTEVMACRTEPSQHYTVQLSSNSAPSQHASSTAATGSEAAISVGGGGVSVRQGSRWWGHVWVTGSTVATKVLAALASPAGQDRSETLTGRSHVFCVAPYDEAISGLQVTPSFFSSAPATPVGVLAPWSTLSPVLVGDPTSSSVATADAITSGSDRNCLVRTTPSVPMLGLDLSDPFALAFTRFDQVRVGLQCQSCASC